MITDVIIVPGTDEVLSLADAKKHLRVEKEYTDEDSLITAYIDAAVEICENFTGCSISGKQMILKMDQFENPFIMPAFPVKTVTSVKYFSADGSAEATMPDTDYVLTASSVKKYSLRFLKDLPAVASRFDAVSITAEIGFAEGEVPKPIIQAILLHVGDMYERREDRSEVISTAAMSLLRAYKKY